MKVHSYIFFYIICISCFSQTIERSLIDETVAVHLLLKNNEKRDSVIGYFTVENQSKEAIYLLQIDPNMNYSPEIEKFDFRVNFPFTDPLISKRSNIDLIQLKPGKSFQLTKKELGNIESINEIRIVFEIFSPDQIASNKIQKKFEKSLKRNSPQISIKHYLDRRSYRQFYRAITL